MNFRIYILFFLAFSLLVLALPACKKQPSGQMTELQKDSAGKTKKKQKKEIKRSELRFESDTAEVTDIVVLNTSMGKIKLGLYGNEAPLTVENFIGLSKKGYYNGVLFHRVASNFLIQSGDGTTKSNSKKTEWGKGGKSIWNNEFADELDVHSAAYQTGYVKGTLAMANRGKNTNTSQFFICLNDAKKLEKKWTIFGKVIEGYDVVEKISRVEIIPGPFEQNDGTPKKPIRINSVSVLKQD